MKGLVKMIYRWPVDLLILNWSRDELVSHLKMNPALSNLEKTLNKDTI